MIKKMLHHTVLSALVISMLAGGYTLTLGSGLEPSHDASHSNDHDHDRDRWDG